MAGDGGLLQYSWLAACRWWPVKVWLDGCQELVSCWGMTRWLPGAGDPIENGWMAGTGGLQEDDCLAESAVVL